MAHLNGGSPSEKIAGAAGPQGKKMAGAAGPQGKKMAGAAGSQGKKWPAPQAPKGNTKGEFLQKEMQKKSFHKKYKRKIEGIPEK